MAQWRKKFEKWKDAKQPVDADEVKALLQRVFGERYQMVSGTSHQFRVEVPELSDIPEFKHGHFIVPLKSGQKVKAFYLRNAYEAAVLLELYPPREEDEEDDDKEKEDNEQNDENK